MYFLCCNSRSLNTSSCCVTFVIVVVFIVALVTHLSVFLVSQLEVPVLVSQLCPVLHANLQLVLGENDKYSTKMMIATKKMTATKEQQ